MTATTVGDRSLLPGPTWPPSVPPPTSFPLADRHPAVLADDPCEAGFSGAGPEYAGIYLHARYFDPQLGTFLSPDPIGVAGGMNLYGDALGDPVNRVDRTGLDPCRVLTEGPRAGQPQCQGTYVDVRPADEDEPVEALMDLIRGGMLFMDGVQKQLTSRQAIEQERRIMQADSDEQDRVAAEQAEKAVGDTGDGTATTTPGVSNPQKAPSSGIAGGVGIGLFGVFSQVFGIAGGGDVKAVIDNSGNFGIMVCGNGGLAAGEAGGGGAAVTGTLGSGTIHDLAGLSVQVEGGGGNGVFAKGSAGGYVSGNSAGVVGSVGLGEGLGAYGAVQAVGCKLVVSVHR